MRFATVAKPTDDDWLEYGPTFHGANPGKRSLTLDFATPAGKELLLRLVDEVDVVVENFTPRVLPNAGLDHEVLLGRNPSVIVLRMPGFGLDGNGPDADASGADPAIPRRSVREMSRHAVEPQKSATFADCAPL